MKENYKLNQIIIPLLAWYDSHARRLPWRQTTAPYQIWVSEIMLQQTKVETVIPYYNRFIEQLPDMKSLAEAKEERLLKLWEGLGYYNRARHMQKAAQTIMTRFSGQFPQSYQDILSLPGIGQYTAGAIASICFGQPVAAIDGNVLRVITRLTDCADDISAPAVKKQIAQLLQDIYPPDRSGDFTQSLMELGATVCLPKNLARCNICPLSALCLAHEHNTQAMIPVRKAKPIRKMESKTVFLLRCGDKLAIRQRAANGLLGGLWEFPNTAGILAPAQAKDILGQWGVIVTKISSGPRKKHVFTHMEWDMVSYVVICENMAEAFVWVTKEKLVADIALPSAFRLFLS